MIQVAQAIDEDASRRAPMEWLVEAILVLLKWDAALDESTACDAEGGRVHAIALWSLIPGAIVHPGNREL